jgi:adenosylhomocysteine nucleosidase
MGEWFEQDDVLFFHGGWGKISAAATAQFVLNHFNPILLVNIGTCGGFAGSIESGAVILVERTIVYDIFEQMGDSDEAIARYTTKLDLSWLRQPYPHPVLKGLLVSADRDILIDDIPMLVEKYGAVAADWESGAIAWVAQKNGVRCLILRGVTDLVGGQGGEAYGNIDLFHERTRSIMNTLLAQLPDWLISASAT